MSVLLPVLMGTDFGALRNVGSVGGPRALDAAVLALSTFAAAVDSGYRPADGPPGSRD